MTTLTVCPKLLLFLALASGTATGDEPDACKTLRHDYQQLSSQELHAIAEQCTSPPIQRLYQKRAYNLTLLDDFGHYQRLATWATPSGNNDRYDFVAHQTFIQLVENFARTQLPDTQATASYLNAVYDKAFEIAELRLKGYDNRAQWIERNEGYSQIGYGRQDEQ